ncbi:hypothetical protein ACFHWD_03515 [Clostridium sp. MT-14]|uniref:hypothetical protein n=1 Tax=Clostridium sp. MT-14 TaxID=3348360 RepID=UPI0035F445BF
MDLDSFKTMESLKKKVSEQKNILDKCVRKQREKYLECAKKDFLSFFKNEQFNVQDNDTDITVKLENMSIILEIHGIGKYINEHMALNIKIKDKIDERYKILIVNKNKVNNNFIISDNIEELKEQLTKIKAKIDKIENESFVFMICEPNDNRKFNSMEELLKEVIKQIEI